ncbi:PREDICTED: lysine-specific demethylase hairless [Calidris pugnax]|uniref:lysine-specific demethylase hairless n=1 Tax=Calidris pugnax TaxID=198806 RepID=UPI00071D88E7|nr:PREDICTED: lysine-specific demethylase hairless [Calidris pugnax]
MASDARMGETPPQGWRRTQEGAAQDARGMESSGVGLSRSTATELGLPAYQEPGKLSYGTEKGCPWRGSEGCLGTGGGLAGGRLGCPYPPAPPCLRDTLCRPKDGAELPPLPPRNGQPKAGWAEACKDHPGARWAEAMLAPLALYSHAYHRYPLPLPGMETQRPGTTGKPHGAAGDGAGDPPTFHHCPFLVEAKHSPFLLSSLLPTGPPSDPQFGGGGAEGPGTMGDGRLAGVDWRLGSYVPAWGQPIYLGVPPRCKVTLSPFEDCSGSGNKEFYPKKEPGFHPPAKDQAPSQMLGKGQAGQDGDGEGGEPDLPGAPWRDGRAGGSSVVPTPRARTPPPIASHPLFLLQPGTAGGCGGPWVGTRAHAADFPPELGSGHPPEPKELEYQSLGGTGEPDPSSPLTDGHYPPALAKPEQPPACLCPTPGCDGCPGVGCGVLGPFEPTLGIPGGHFSCPPSNHTKLKKTWLTRHSEQSLPRCKAARRDGGPEVANEGKRPGKRPHGTTDGPWATSEGAGATKRVTKATVATARPGGGTESGGDAEERRMELGEGDPLKRAQLDPREPWCLQSVPCVTLPESIPRCCACAARAPGEPQGEEEEEEEEPPESTCRLLHFRRFAFGDGGELNMDGFCTVGEADGDAALRLEGPGAQRGGRGAGSSLCLAKYLLGVLGDPFCEAVRRDRDVWPGAPGGPEGKFAFGDGGELNMDGFCTVGEADGDAALRLEGPGAQRGGRGAGSSLCLAKYLLGVLGDPFCEAVRRDRDVWPGAPGGPEGVTAWRRGEGAPQLCDSCRRGFFNSHWSCPRCGFQLCPDCHRSRQEADGHGTNFRAAPPVTSLLSILFGLLWLHDPGHPTNYKLFQEHWRRGQPVFVSGLQKRLEGRLWGPESFLSAWGERAVEVENLRAPGSHLRMSSREFWEGFAANGASPKMERGSEDLLKLETGFGDTEVARATNLRASLPLPEYCGPTGRLNLATYLRGQRARRWLRPRLCVAYGVHPQDRTIGTKNLTVEATDSINILVHAAARQDPLPQADAEGLDPPLMERLWDAGGQPAALWHIFRPEDAGRIQDFLQKACEDQRQEGAEEPPRRYLDISLRRRLREELGVSGWTLLQFLGDAVLVPAGAPHQVQSLTGTISVEQRFLSPENVARPGDHVTHPQLCAQLDGMIFSAVREAVGILRGCK